MSRAGEFVVAVFISAGGILTAALALSVLLSVVLR